eukprot:883170_1
MVCRQTPLDGSLSEFLDKRRGTIPYIAPEMLQFMPYNHAVDIYSFGVMFATLLYGKYVFDARDWQELHREHGYFFNKMNQKGDYKFTFNDITTNEEFRNIVRAMMDQIPNNRPDAITLFAHFKDWNMQWDSVRALLPPIDSASLPPIDSASLPPIDSASSPPIDSASLKPNYNPFRGVIDTAYVASCHPSESCSVSDNSNSDNSDSDMDNTSPNAHKKSHKYMPFPG